MKRIKNKKTVKYCEKYSDEFKKVVFFAKIN